MPPHGEPTAAATESRFGGAAAGAQSGAPFTMIWPDLVSAV